MGAGGSIDILTQETIDMSAKQINALANNRFDELDTDKSGFLENDELIKVTDWVMDQFGDKLGTDPVVVRRQIMARLDTNGDGKLDREEFLVLFKIVLERMAMKERAREKFVEFDVDKSGFLEAKEIDQVITWTLQAFPADDNIDVYRERLVKQIDGNGDGKLDLNEFLVLFEDMLVRTELMGRAKVKFDELDEDKSGMLEKSELNKVTDWVLQTYTEKSVTERANFKSTLLKRIDVNGDGKLSLQEFTVIFDEILQRMDLISRAKNEFDRLDTDKSGFLEKNELTAILKVWGQTVLSEIKIDASGNIEDLLSKLDANGDGKISLMEFVPLFDQCIAKSGIWTRN